MNKNTLDIAIIGNIGIDTNVYLPSETFQDIQESSFTKNVDVLGQAGGYTTFQYNNLGLKTTFIGYVGDDFSGKFIAEKLKERNISTEGVFIDPAGTSRSINLINRHGIRKNFYDGKSHMNLDVDLVKCVKIIEGCRAVHFHLPNWSRKLLKLVRNMGITIITDLQDISSLDDAYRYDFIECSDYLFFSSVNYPDPAIIMHHIWTINPRAILVSGMGSRGCATGVNGKISYHKAIDLKEPIIDTNGAGDTLACGIIYSLLFDYRSFDEAVLRGQIAARYNCSLDNGALNLIKREELESIFKMMLPR